MKTASLTYPAQQVIDLAPLAARYEVLSQAVLAYLAAGQMRAMVRCSRKVLRVVQLFTKLDAQNKLWALKFEMLSNKNWRERVLSDLGGMRKLRLWEAARGRILARRGEPACASKDTEPSWLFTLDRIAESERLKAHARKCLRAGAEKQPNVFRDRVKMDFYGMFCLPSLPRVRAKRQSVKVYTQNTIVDYKFNAMRFGKEEGFGPAIVWPVEFYAAAQVEARLIAEGTLFSVIPAKAHCAAEPGPNAKVSSLLLGPASSTFGLVRDDKLNCAMPLHRAIDPKIYRDIFENPV